MMPRIALVGWTASVADLLEAVLASEGHPVDRVPLDADTVRVLVRRPPDVIVIDEHRFMNVHALTGELRAHGELAGLPVVLVGPSEPVEVPGIEVVPEQGRSLDLGALLRAVNRAVGAYAG
jgi:DNA-binding response OmpR family regulator